MVRLVSCGVGECRHAAIDKERDKDAVMNKKRRKNNSITEHVQFFPCPS